MPTTAFTSATIGTKLAAATGTKITDLTINQPTSASDVNTPLVLADAAAAPVAPSTTLFAANLIALSFMFGIKPSGPSVAPGLTAPTWPVSVVKGANIPFANGVFVQNCPAGVTFNLTTA